MTTRDVSIAGLRVDQFADGNPATDAQFDWTSVVDRRSEVAIAEFVTTSVVDVVGGDGCAVFINQPGTDRLQVRAALGFATDEDP